MAKPEGCWSDRGNFGLEEGAAVGGQPQAGRLRSSPTQISQVMRYVLLPPLRVRWWWCRWCCRCPTGYQQPVEQWVCMTVMIAPGERELSYDNAEHPTARTGTRFRYIGRD